MASLVYHDEHLAWKQRISKEENLAGPNKHSPPKFRNAISLKTTNHKKNLISKDKIKSNDFSTFPLLYENLKEIKLGNEYRGKYARHPKFEKTKLNLKQKNKSSYGGPFGYDYFPKKLNNDAIYNKYINSNRHSLSFQENEFLNLGKKKIRNHRQNLSSSKNEHYILHGDIYKTAQKSSEDDNSLISFGFQQKYIKELESLVKNEKIKRIDAEEKLKIKKSRYS